MDLDDFKDINDTYGHHVGDRALREVAGVLRAGIRPYDICVRYAGDEFIVVLSGCGGEEAERKRLELQRAVDGLAVRGAAGQDAAARHQHRRRGLPARRRFVRNAARQRRQPHVPRQDAAQARHAGPRQGNDPGPRPIAIHCGLGPVGRRDQAISDRPPLKLTMRVREVRGVRKVQGRTSGNVDLLDLSDPSDLSDPY